MKSVGKILNVTPNLHDVRDSRKIVYPVHLGIELEVENAGEMANKLGENNYWHIVPDGSLRNNGLEFVCKNPLAGSKLALAIDRLMLSAKDTNPVANVNCSTHVHMDFTTATPNQLFNFIFTYILFEEALASWCGNWRKNNMFCLTFANAEMQTRILADAYKYMRYTNEEDAIQYLRQRDPDVVKYSALNVSSLRRFGTLECRLAPAFVQKENMYTWVNMLLSIRKFSDKIDNPMSLLIKLSQSGADALAKEVFGDYAQEILPHIDEWDLYEAIDRVQFIVNQ